MTSSVARRSPAHGLAAFSAIVAVCAFATVFLPDAEGAASTPQFTNPTQITNPYLPISSIASARFEGTKEGVDVVSVKTRRNTTKAFTVGGQTVQAVIVEDRVTEDGVLHEVALDYYAQANDGTVHYLGEDVDNYGPDGTTIINHDGAFLYGVDTKTLGVAMPANPKLGTKFTFEKVPKQGSETNRVTSLTATVSVPAGTFTNALEIAGYLSPGGERETKWYKSGIGLINEADAGGAVGLVSFVSG